MARDRANINTNIWTDDDWRDLTRDEHWLYTVLLTSSALSYAGVADWRPKRLAQHSSDTTPQDIERIGALLEAKRFIFVDAETEEVLVRSFLRHDGLLKQPKLAVSMANAYGAISSKAIRKVVIHELKRLGVEHPEWRAFDVEQVKNLLKLSGSDMSTFTPNAGQAQALPTSTSTTTPTEDKSSLLSLVSSEDEKKKPETKIPNTWAPTASHIARAKEKGVDVMRQAEAFKLHAETHDRRAANWNAAFTTWLIKATPEVTALSANSPWNRGYHQ